jgi:hypothetical protein
MSNASAEPASGSRSKTAEFVTWAARNLAPGVIAGFVSGLIVGGAGSRLAMRILALTSAEFVRGAGTEAGATIGEITLEGTLFLVVAGSILGILGGSSSRRFAPSCRARVRREDSCSAFSCLRSPAGSSLIPTI